VKVRRAVPGEGRIVARQLRASLPPAFVPFTIWGSVNAGAWVETHLTMPQDPASSMYYLLITPGGEPAGVTEFRSVLGNAFWNHVGISQAYRGRGYGHLLLEHALDDFLALHSAEQVLIDVDPSNVVSYAWVRRRLGFAPCGETCWQLGEIKRQTVRAGAVLALADADAMHRQFGFSRLRIETRKGTYDVGRLDRDYFRLDEQAWNDPGVHAALHQLDATRRILLVTSKAQPDLRMLRRTERLALRTAVLQETCTESARIGGCQTLSANKLRGATVRERAAL
jgi:ribosomal protein S18 acetylase RimI-like enzyme